MVSGWGPWGGVGGEREGGRRGERDGEREVGTRRDGGDLGWSFGGMLLATRRVRRPRWDEELRVEVRNRIHHQHLAGLGLGLR
jgi:hypothetical protein